MNSKELVRGMFRGDRKGRAPFVPWLSSFAAKIEQVPLERMFTNPDLLSKAMRNAQKLCGHDAVTNIFDPSLEAEACGCRIKWVADGLPVVVSHPLAEGARIEDIDVSQLEKRGRIPIVLEATRQLKLTIGETVAIIAMITGPLTIASHLMGDKIVDKLEQKPEEAEKTINYAIKIMRELCTKYCELNVDVIAIDDDCLATLKPELIRKIGSRLTPLWNITRFYRANSLILTRNAKREQAEAISSLGADGVVLGAPLPSGDLIRRAKVRIGFALPLAILLKKEGEFEDQISRCLAQMTAADDFLTTEWDIPIDTPIQNMYKLAQVLQRHWHDQR